MGLLRCPKCDAICHSDEEVCHVCGHVLKVVEKTKENTEKPLETPSSTVQKEEKIETSSISSTQIKPNPYLARTDKTSISDDKETSSFCDEIKKYSNKPVEVLEEKKEKYQTKYVILLFSSIFLTPFLILMGILSFINFGGEGKLFAKIGGICFGLSILFLILLITSIVRLVQFSKNPHVAIKEEEKRIEQSNKVNKDELVADVIEGVIDIFLD